MHHFSILTSLLALLTLVTAFPLPFHLPSPRTLVPRINITDPLGLGIDTGSDIGDLAEFSPIEDGFLEGDNDSGDGNDNGSSGVSVANGLTGGGSGSATQNDGSGGSTSSFCSE